MQTATLDDLRNRLPTILAWLESGEDVVVKGKPVAPPETTAEKKADWSKSTGFRDRTGETVLNQRDLDELFDDMRGPY